MCGVAGMSVGDVGNRFHWSSASVFVSDLPIGLEFVYAARGWIYTVVRSTRDLFSGYDMLRVVSGVWSVWSV